MQYRVTRDYKTNAIDWHKGDMVTVEEDFAAWVNRDSPGVLIPAVDEQRAPEQAPADRMARGSRKRSKTA